MESEQSACLARNVHPIEPDGLTRIVESGCAQRGTYVNYQAIRAPNLSQQRTLEKMRDLGAVCPTPDDSAWE